MLVLNTDFRYIVSGTEYWLQIHCIELFCLAHHSCKSSRQHAWGHGSAKTHPGPSKWMTLRAIYQYWGGQLKDKDRAIWTHTPHTQVIFDRSSSWRAVLNKFPSIFQNHWTSSLRLSITILHTHLFANCLIRNVIVFLQIRCHWFSCRVMPNSVKINVFRSQLTDCWGLNLGLHKLICLGCGCKFSPVT